MSIAKLPDGCEIFYQDDDFTDPWKPKETIMMLHGFARNSNFWYSWVPRLARHYRVLRWDARGCGRSTMPEPGYPWSIEGWTKDLSDFLDAMNCEKTHVIGESLGGMMAACFGAWYPNRVKSLVLCTAPLHVAGVAAKDLTLGASSMNESIKKAGGGEAWGMATMDNRLDPTEVSQETREWFAAEWGRTSERTFMEWSNYVPDGVDLTAELLQQIKAPTLVIAPSKSPLRFPAYMYEFMQEHIPNYRLTLIEAKSQAIYIAKADECVDAVLKFLETL